MIDARFFSSSIIFSLLAARFFYFFVIKKIIRRSSSGSEGGYIQQSYSMNRKYIIFIIGCLALVVTLGFVLPKQWNAPPAPIENVVLPTPVVDNTVNNTIQLQEQLASQATAESASRAASVCRGVACYAPTDAPVETAAPDNAPTATVDTPTTTSDTAAPTPTADKPTTTATATVSTKQTKTATKAPIVRQIDVRLQVVGGSTYALTVPAGSTVEAVMQAARSDGLDYRLKAFGGMGSYVTALDGKAEDTAASMYWILYVNGAKAQVGMSSYTVKNGDQVQWQYEHGY